MPDIEQSLRVSGLSDSLIIWPGAGVMGSAMHSGTLADLWANRDLLDADCLQDDVPVQEYTDNRPLPAPPVGPNGYWYLVRAWNDCGDGTGSDSGGLTRTVPACP